MDSLHIAQSKRLNRCAYWPNTVCFCHTGTLLTGLFGRVWFSKLATQPNIEKILNDLDNFSEASARLADMVEKLPDQIAIERDTTIKQAMKNITRLTMTTIDESAKRCLRNVRRQ